MHQSSCYQLSLLVFLIRYRFSCWVLSFGKAIVFDETVFSVIHSSTGAIPTFLWPIWFQLPKESILHSQNLLCLLCFLLSHPTSSRMKVKVQCIWRRCQVIEFVSSMISTQKAQVGTWGHVWYFWSCNYEFKIKIYSFNLDRFFFKSSSTCMSLDVGLIFRYVSFFSWHWN